MEEKLQIPRFRRNANPLPEIGRKVKITSKCADHPPPSISAVQLSLISPEGGRKCSSLATNRKALDAEAKPEAGEDVKLRGRT